ncbi:hypothetical protein Micbo1qcDRAFT_222885 [Microdochium bolleyi]|uniref:BZIP domain-containing protein n=1 Tax=Microdochium bolleyi TaxID=196109 RepID=A0A136J827_9PEZI|nr:hypothetical protein Micbo1qcDRAFT_222885 [Microdochium bolleyi]
MASGSNFLYHPSDSEPQQLALFGSQAVASSSIPPDSHQSGSHHGLDKAFLMNYPSQYDFDPMLRPSSSSSPNLSLSTRRRQSSCVTATSCRSLESDSQSSTGPSGTPESRPLGSATTPENTWPALNPKPSKQTGGGSSFNPIQNSYTLPPRRPRRASNKPKPELSREEKEARKVHSREKNKDAADRARRKKKKHANELEESQSELETKNSTLKKELESLTQEAARIRAELMAHSDCHDQSVGRWADTEVKQYLGCDSTPYSQAPPLSYHTSQASLVYATTSSSYPGTAFQLESPSPPGYNDAVYHSDAGYTHSPGIYGEDQDPSFVTEMQASVLVDPAFVSDLIQDQYLDYHADLNYPPIPDGPYQ